MIVLFKIKQGSMDYRFQALSGALLWSIVFLLNQKSDAKSLFCGLTFESPSYPSS